MNVCIISDCHQWDEFIAGVPYGAITQSYTWGELARAVGMKPLRIGVLDEQGKLCAALGILVASLPRLGVTYFYAPRGPILADPRSGAMAALLQFAREQARAYKAFMLKIEPAVEMGTQHWSDALKEIGFRPTAYTLHVRNEWILDISPEEEEILAKMKAQWRRNIRLATQKGVLIRQGKTADDLHAFYKLLRITSEQNNFFIHGEEYFRKLLYLFGKDQRAVLLLAEYEGEIAGGVIALRFGDWAWYRFGASSSQHRNLRANHLLQWKSIQWAKSQGCRHYNFLGIPTDSADTEDPLYGIYFFKQGFGGYARCSMESYELAYNPFIYKLYHTFQSWKHPLREQSGANNTVAENVLYPVR